jgi:hypothetical protein
MAAMAVRLEVVVVVVVEQVLKVVVAVGEAMEPPGEMVQPHQQATAVTEVTDLV